jgi:ABC-type multidrug transport system fused ATPase/permease subunit
MYSFIKEFFKFLSHINKTHKVYYASYTIALIFATTLNMSLTYFYGKLIDSMTAKTSFSRYIWVYGGILFGTFIFFAREA